MISPPNLPKSFVILAFLFLFNSTSPTAPVLITQKHEKQIKHGKQNILIHDVSIFLRGFNGCVTSYNSSSL